MTVTTPARALLELAATEPEETLTRALGQGELLRIVSRRGIAGELQRWRGQRGVAVLRDLIADDLAPAPTASWLEDVFLPLVRRAGLPRPQTNAWLHGFRVDAYWPDAGVVVELDSRGFHTTPEQIEADKVRDARLAARGLVVLRFTYRRLTREPYAVIADLAAALSAAGRRAAA